MLESLSLAWGSGVVIPNCLHGQEPLPFSPHTLGYTVHCQLAPGSGLPPENSSRRVALPPRNYVAASMRHCIVAHGRLGQMANGPPSSWSQWPLRCTVPQ